MDLFAYLMSKKKGALPSEYTQVAYIESTGTQYINTGVTNNGYKSETELAWTSLTGGDNGRQLMGSNVVGFWGINNGKYEIYQISNYSAEVGRWDKVVFEVTKDSSNSYRYLTVNDNVLFNGQTSTSMPGSTIIIFAIDTNLYGRCSCKLKYQKIWNNEGTLVRDFIPCYRNSDNVIGLYDLVNKQFYTNQGTGAFISGAEVKNPPSRNIAEYILLEDEK